MIQNFEQTSKEYDLSDRIRQKKYQTLNKPMEL